MSQDLTAFQDALIASRIVEALDATLYGPRAAKRKEDSDKLHSGMHALRPKVDNADRAARKKFDSSYEKLFVNGETAAKVAALFLKSFEHDVKPNSEAFHALSMLHKSLRDWENNKSSHIMARNDSTRNTLLQADHTWAYATLLDDWIVKCSGIVGK